MGSIPGQAPLANQPSLLQAKPAISRPGDRTERQADRVAKRLTRDATAHGWDGPTGSAEQRLPAPEQRFYEARLGHDLSQVRIHADGEAARSARSLDARAYTVGSDVVFGAGQYRPGTRSGQRLLAHELTHVVQQRSSGPILQRKRRRRPTGGRKGGAGKQIVIYARGYKPYKSEAKEIEFLDSGMWLPTSADFEQTAFDTQSRNIYGAANASEFFGALQKAKGRIKRVVVIGHGGTSGISLSGGALSFGFSQGVDVNALETWKVNISRMKHKFAKANIDIYACDLGLGGAFAAQLAKSFGATVRAYDGPVYWCVRHRGNRIVSRGRISPPKVKRAEECSGAGWYKGVNKLIPPVRAKP